MRKFLGITTGLVLATLWPVAAGSQGTPQKPVIDFTVLHAQVILDHLGFSPGILDGQRGRSLTAALKGFQEVNRIPETGELDRVTLEALHPYRALRPTRMLALTASALEGPFVNPMPKDPVDQAKLPSMAYRNRTEKLAEMFHTTPAVLLALNSPDTLLKPGGMMRFPNALPGSRDYSADLDPVWRRTLSELNVDARQPEGDYIVVDKSDRTLRVYDKGNRLVALFSATMGSSYDPLPLGEWKIQGVSRNPDFHYNPELFWDVSDSKQKVLLPPGPNGPVGVVWLDLNKPHYGIHGTPEPQTIGRSESHGCIRLTNWDAARLSLMVKPGTRALFQE